MKTYLGNILLLFLTMGCFQTTNSDLIKKIDQLSKMSIEYKLKVNSDGEIIDTVSIRKYKNDLNNILYEELINFIKSDTLVTKKYYHKDETLFYSETTSQKFGKITLFEAWVNNNKINSGLFVEYKNGIASDSIILDYTYPSSHVCLIKYIVNDGVIKQKHIYDNSNSKPSKEYEILDKDTIRVANYTYDNGKLNRKVVVDYVDSTSILSEYNQNEDLIYENIIAINSNGSRKPIQRTEMLVDTISRNGAVEVVHNYLDSSISYYTIDKNE